MTRDEFATLLDSIQAAERETRAAGQREYAHTEGNAFGNFERIAAELMLPRETVLWIYFRKHCDGIAAWLNGHRSQREDVRGRIKDARLYLALLWGMVEEGEQGKVADPLEQQRALGYVEGIQRAMRELEGAR